MTTSERADYLFLLSIAEDFYEWLGGELQVEVDRIWKEYEATNAPLAPIGPKA